MEDQRRTMIERTSNLRCKIFAWIEVQNKFFPGLSAIRDLEDEAHMHAAESQPLPGVQVWDIGLWLPWAIA
jgi:hypothetical protein